MSDKKATASSGKRILNINVGVLGHVDSGKTSLGASHRYDLPCRNVCPPCVTHACFIDACSSPCCPNARSSLSALYCAAAVAALSTRLSTAALDKHLQSKERGITLDLGFSAFTVS